MNESRIQTLTRVLERSMIARGFMGKTVVTLICIRSILAGRHVVTRSLLARLIALFYRQELLNVWVTLNGRPLQITLRREDDDLDVFRELVMGDYEVPEKMPAHIVDAGANIGMFSILAASVFPETKIDAYEPNPASVEILAKNILNNDLLVTVHRAALWPENKRLNLLPRTPKLSQVSDAGNTGVTVEGVRVTITPDTWLKMDIEGAEYEVLPDLLGGSAIPPRWISLELHYVKERGAGIMSLLRQRGYQLTPSEFPPEADCVVLFAELT